MREVGGTYGSGPKGGKRHGARIGGNRGTEAQLGGLVPRLLRVDMEGWPIAPHESVGALSCTDRSVQVPCQGGNPAGRNHHTKLFEAHNADRVKNTDRGVESLIRDLGQRGLLGSSFAILPGLFGRTPRESTDGRDHNGKAPSFRVAGS